MKNTLFKTNILTLFPEIFPGPLSYSLTGKAIENKKVILNPINIRDFAADKHNTVDDTVYGGGAGMLLKPDVLGKAIESIPKYQKKPIIYMSPRGKPLTQNKVKDLSKEKEITIISGRYEGIDQRIIDHYNVEEISIGDYILTNGDIAAIILLDAIIRLLPNVLGNEESPKTESFENNLLEAPNYTRPEIWKSIKIPEILKTGNHKKIKEWKIKKAEELTKNIRPDLFKKYKETK